MSNLTILLPKMGKSLLMQEECCWGRSMAMPGLALRLAQIMKVRGFQVQFRTVALDPLEEVDLAGEDAAALIFSWVFGDRLEPLVRRLTGQVAQVHVVANPDATAPILEARFPYTKVLTASLSFSDSADMDMSIPPLLMQAVGEPLSGVTYQYATGCPWRCAFCVWRNKPRLRDPELVGREFGELCRMVGGVALADRTGEQNNLLGNEITGKGEWLGQLCDVLAPLGLTWTADVNVRNVTLADLDRARDAGMRWAIMGIEFLDDEILMALRKGHDVFDAMVAMGWCRERGIRYRFSLRQGVSEKPRHVRHMMDHIIEIERQGLRPDRLIIGAMVNWPGRKWLPVNELAEPECYNLGSAAYPRWAMRLPEETLSAWRDVRALCQELGWIPKPQEDGGTAR